MRNIVLKEKIRFDPRFRDQEQNLGRNVKIKLEICNLRIRYDTYRAFKIYAS
jgi:hypothetical protein